jgi:thiol-disulfide isomerase/thioredoxin
VADFHRNVSGQAILAAFVVSVWIGGAASLTGRAEDIANEVVEKHNSKADKLWKELDRIQSRDWGKPRVLTHKEVMEGLPRIADKARAFYTQYPDHPNAEEAHEMEYRYLDMAWFFGATNLTPRLIALEQERVKDPNLRPRERFLLRKGPVQRLVDGPLDEFEHAALALQKDYPEELACYDILERLLDRSGTERSQKLAAILLNSPIPDKPASRRFLDRLRQLGRPVQIKFKAVDGRDVDVSKMKGNVVLVEFWATWCGPCVAQIPTIKAAYAKFHGQGFEVVAVNLDKSVEKLRKFVREKNLPWPQCFREKGGTTDFAREFGISSIPALLIIDKRGNLRDFNGSEPEVFDEQIAKLLSEP